MKTGVRTFAVVAVLLPCLTFGQAQTKTGSNTVRVSGRLLGPKEPIRHQPITLRGATREELAKAETEEDGRFTFPDVRPNQHYFLSIALKGFYPWNPGIDVGGQDMDAGNLCPQPHRPVHLSGRIVSYTGEPIRQETATLDLDGREVIATRTDQNGNFDLSPAQPDQHYSLHIAVDGFVLTIMPIDAEYGDVDMGTVVLQPLRPLRAGAAAQQQTRHNLLVSGRITDTNGVPLTERNLNFKMMVPFQPPGPVSTLKPDSSGRFILSIESRNQYEIYIPEPGVQPNYRLVARIAANDGWDFDFGNIAVQSSTHNILGPHSPLDFPLGELLGPVTVATSKTSSGPNPSSVQTVSSVYPAAIFIGADGLVSIVQSDGKLVQPSKEKEQVGGRSPMFSDDRKAVGWLVDSDFCCTSYPIQPMLVVYPPGKPLRHFTGDGRAIFRWGFVDGGKRVAFYQDFLHGTPWPHYELHDVESERLIEKWDGDLTPRAPSWTKGVRF